MTRASPAFASVTAEAPAGIGNLAVGFDILGQAMAAPHDRVTLQASQAPGLRIVEVTGLVTQLPTSPEKNSATAGVLRMFEDYQAGFGADVVLEKGINLGSGMGGSAASAVAGVTAAAALLGIDPGPDALLSYALDGEEAATGARHADNAASALLGGVVLVSVNRKGATVLRRLATPPEVFSVLVHPHLELETRRSRAVLPAHFARSAVVEQTGLLAGFVVACERGDLELLSNSLRDVLVEPHRAPLITGFDQVQAAALGNGALGCSISGGGPSVFAWCAGAGSARDVGEAMQRAFADAGIASDVWVSDVAAPGARVVSACAT